MTIRARLYDARGDDRDVDLGELDLAKVDDRRLVWIDVDDRTDDTLGRVQDALQLEPAILQQLRPDRRRPRVVRAPERVAVTLVAVEPAEQSDPDEKRLIQKPIDLVAGRNLVLTIHDGPVLAINAVAEQFRGEQQVGELDAGALVTALVDEMLTRYLSEVEDIEREIDRLDTLALQSDRDDSAFLRGVVILRRRIALLRRSLTPNRNALGPLVRPDFQVHADILEPWPGIVDRLERAIDAVENARESLVGSFDIYLGVSAHRSNDVMKLLTLVSAILLPAVVLAGIMGMNFRLEFFDNPGNFLIVVGAMAAFALLILLAARWRRWI
jgi:magnesium/cobalt transport protein CorA